MRQISTLLLLTCFLSCGTPEHTGNGRIFSVNLEHSLISSGDNFPDFNPSRDNADYFLFSLHKHIPLSEFKKETNSGDQKINELITLLKSKNWLHLQNGELKPMIFIADSTDGANLFREAKDISVSIADTIMSVLPGLERKFHQTNIAATQSFKSWSFFIMSDVLLDSWQINNVENLFLKQAERPLRNGKHYYYSLMEKSTMEMEAFGIYGNQVESVNNRSMSIYGNNRVHAKAQVTIHKISKPDNKLLDQMAEDFTPRLMSILGRNRSAIQDVYERSGYAAEISFNEFFIWWYHFIYTQTTDILNQRNVLNIPPGGNFEYELE
jgi:hypothetical protein